MILNTFVVLSIILSFSLCVYALSEQRASNKNLLNNGMQTSRENTLHVRFKRQGGGGGGSAGRYAEAAQVSQVKVLRLILQMLKNFWDPSFVGGTHPLHVNVPKAVVFLFKQKVEQFFFPPIGGDPKKVVHT